MVQFGRVQYQYVQKVPEREQDDMEEDIVEGSGVRDVLVVHGLGRVVEDDGKEKL